jgi:hypothetical protein
MRWALPALALLCGPAFGWGPEGHQVIGSTADQLLNSHAKQEVTRILGIPLRVASTWPDCARSVQRQSDGSFKYEPDPHFEAPCTSFDKAGLVDYVSCNWSNCTYEDKPTNCHKAFHFADVAIQHDDYERKFVGTNDHDVVSAINAAVAVLQNKSPRRGRTGQKGRLGWWVSWAGKDHDDQKRSTRPSFVGLDRVRRRGPAKIRRRPRRSRGGLRQAATNQIRPAQGRPVLKRGSRR